MSTIKMNVTVERKLFYNSSSMYGVFALTPNNNEGEVDLNQYGNFVVNGNCPELQEGDSYDIEIEPSTHHKYGDGYTFIAVQSKRPTTASEQREYIRTMVSETHYEEIIKVYPDHLILDIMERDEFDYSNMKGIKEATYQRIKQRLFESLEIQEALVGLKDLDITYNAMQRLIQHFGDASRLVQLVNSNIYALCEVKGFGFETVDKYAMNRGDDPKSIARIRASTYYLLERDSNGDGNSWIGTNELEEELLKALNIDIEHIRKTLSSLYKSEDGLFFDNDKVALKRNQYYEDEVKNILLKKKNERSHTSVADSVQVVNDIESSLGIEYSDEQKKAIQKAIDNNVLIINGRAGSGKTTVVKGVLQSLSSYTYCTTALSGKATQILGQQNLKSMTIHRMLGYDSETGGFLHNKNNRLPYDIIILDESSMVNSYLVYSILSASRDDAKIIFVGDSGQLPPIGTGAVFFDLIQSKVLPQQELTTIHRQAKKSGILEVANRIRDGHHISDSYSYDTQVIGDLKDMVIMPTDEDTDIKQMVIDICKNYADRDLYEFQVLTGRVDSGELSVRNLNLELQEVFNDINKPFVDRGGYQYREGDKVIQNGNNYEAVTWIDVDMFDPNHEEPEEVSVFNGTLGIIEKIEFDSDRTKQEHKVYIRFESVEPLVVYSVNDLQQIAMAYAISCHKSQGSTLKNVIFAFDFASYMLLSREFVYTGITRASNGCVLIANNRALRFAIEKSVGDNRRTFLKDMLLEEVSND